MNNGRLVLYALKAGSQHCRHLPIVLHLVESWHQGEKLYQSRQPARRLPYFFGYPDQSIKTSISQNWCLTIIKFNLGMFQTSTVYKSPKQQGFLSISCILEINLSALCPKMGINFKLIYLQWRQFEILMSVITNSS